MPRRRPRMRRRAGHAGRSGMTTQRSRRSRKHMMCRSLSRLLQQAAQAEDEEVAEEVTSIWRQSRRKSPIKTGSPTLGAIGMRRVTTHSHDILLVLVYHGIAYYSWRNRQCLVFEIALGFGHLPFYVKSSYHHGNLTAGGAGCK